MHHLSAETVIKGSMNWSLLTHWVTVVGILLIYNADRNDELWDMEDHWIISATIAFE